MSIEIPDVHTVEAEIRATKARLQALCHLRKAAERQERTRPSPKIPNRDSLLQRIQTALIELGHPARAAEIHRHMQESGIEGNGDIKPSTHSISSYLCHMANCPRWEVRKVERGLYVWRPREEPTPLLIAGSPT